MSDSEVRSPDGTAYDVGVAWFPRYRRLSARLRDRRRRRRDEDRESAWWDVPSNGLDLGDDLLAGLAIGVALLVVVVLGWFLVIPLLVLVLDVLVVAVLVVVGALSRVLLRRPWKVTVTRADGTTASVGVVGLRAARATRDRAADALRDGATVDEALRTAVVG